MVALFVDLDGTALRHETNEWLPEVLERLAKFHAMGHQIIFITQRGPHNPNKGLSAELTSAENTVRNLVGYAVYVDKVTGSKEARANPFAAYVQNDKMMLIAGDWVKPYVDECEAWPNGPYGDQVDASSGAFNRLAQRIKFDSSYSWVA